MQRRTALLLSSLLLCVPTLALAQSAQKKIRIGILFGDAPMPHEEVALGDGLRELGYVEGRNLVIERRYAEGRLQLVPGYARELAAMNLDAVISTCTPTTRVAGEAFGSTPGSTPIIMAAVADPVGQQLIASLAKPGANVTGLASQAEDIMPKMLELFAGVLPRPTTVAVLVGMNTAYRALATYIGKVVAGTNPGEIPVSQPTQFELVINMKTARALGIALPQTILLSANEAIQ